MKTLDYEESYNEYIKSCKGAGSSPCGFYQWLTDGVDNSLSHLQATSIISKTGKVEQYYTLSFITGYNIAIVKDKLTLPKFNEAIEHALTDEYGEEVKLVNQDDIRDLLQRGEVVTIKVLVGSVLHCCIKIQATAVY